MRAFENQGGLLGRHFWSEPLLNFKTAKYPAIYTSREMIGVRGTLWILLQSTAAKERKLSRGKSKK